MCVQPRSQCEARGLGGWGSGGPGALGACVLRPLAGLRAVGGRLTSRRCSAELGGCPAGRVRGQGCARGRTPLRWAARLGPWGGPAIWVGSSRAAPQEGQTGITAGGGVGEEAGETPSRAPAQPPERGGVPRQHGRPACPSGLPLDLQEPVSSGAAEPDVGPGRGADSGQRPERPPLTHSTFRFYRRLCGPGG